MQSLTLLQEGRWTQAALYIVGTVICCVLSAWAGCKVSCLLS